MKFILLIFVLIFTNNCIRDYSHNDFLKEAKQYCSCHNGINGLIYNTYSYSLVCNDGYKANGSGNILDQHLYSSCKND